MNAEAFSIISICFGKFHTAICFKTVINSECCMKIEFHITSPLPPPPLGRTLSIVSSVDPSPLPFRWIRALSVCSDHCRDMGCRIGMMVILGAMGVARVSHRDRKGSLPVHKASGTHPSTPANGGPSSQGSDQGPSHDRGTTSAGPQLTACC